MEKIKILVVLFVSVLFASCIKDNSNYDYAEMKEILVKLDTYKLTPGETVIMKPKLSYSSSVVDRDKLPLPEVTYEWHFDNQLISTDSVLSFTAGNELGSVKGYLKVRNVATGEIYAGDVDVDIESAYKIGYLILYEDADGQDELGFIRSVINKDSDEDRGSFDTILYKSDHKDLYFTANQRMMNDNAAYFTEHSVSNMNYGGLLTEITLVTENGASIEDLNGASFTRETVLRDEFSGGILPDNFTSRKIVHTPIDSYVISTDNWMYNRRSSDIEAYHTGRFYAAMTHNNVQYSDIFFTYHMNTEALVAVKINAEGKRDYVGIYCEDLKAPQNNGKEVPVIATDNVSEQERARLMADMTDLKEEIISMDYCFSEISPKHMSNCALIKKDNKFYIHYTLFQPALQQLTIQDSRMIDLSAHTGNKEILGMMTSKAAPHAYFYTDNAVYIYDYKANAILSTPVFTVAGKKITAFGAFNKIYNYDYYQEKAALPSIAVGYDNGEVEVYELKREGLEVVSKLVYTAKGYGKIKQVGFKSGMSQEFYH